MGAPEGGRVGGFGCLGREREEMLVLESFGVGALQAQDACRQGAGARLAGGCFSHRCVNGEKPVKGCNKAVKTGDNDGDRLSVSDSAIRNAVRIGCLVKAAAAAGGGCE